MVTLVRNIIPFVLLLLLTISCSNSGSLQAYFVDHQEQPGYLTMDVPKSILNINKADLNPDEQAAFKSVERLNMLAYRIDATNTEGFDQELNKVKAILETDKYEELMRGGNVKDGKFVIKFTGDVEKIDELVLLGHANDKGFAVVRVLGKNMSADKMMNFSKIMSKSNIEEDAFKDLVNFFE